METQEQYAAVMTNRENLYRLLGRFYRVEVDQTLLRRLEGLRFPGEGENDALSAGYRLLEKALRHPGIDPVTDLAVDYARVFLGAGVTKKGVAAYPYESVYTSPQRLVMQEARDEVLAAYRARGLDRAAGFDVPEDHLALELAFMAHLCGESQAALAAGDRAALAGSLAGQKAFLERHLLNWTPAFCADVRACAGTDFYRAVAEITEHFLLLDRDMLDALLAEQAQAA